MSAVGFLPAGLFLGAAARGLDPLAIALPGEDPSSATKNAAAVEQQSRVRCIQILPRPCMFGPLGCISLRLSRC